MSAGCDDVTSPLLNFKTSHGCPSTCTVVHSKQLASIQCTDASADDPKLKALVTRYMQYFNVHASHYRRRKDLATLVDNNGCDGLKDNRTKNTPGLWTDNEVNCEFWSLDVKSLSTLCPVTCGCAHKKESIQGSIQCPTTCFHNPAH